MQPSSAHDEKLLRHLQSFIRAQVRPNFVSLVGFLLDRSLDLGDVALEDSFEGRGAGFESEERSMSREMQECPVTKKHVAKQRARVRQKQDEGRDERAGGGRRGWPGRVTMATRCDTFTCRHAQTNFNRD